MYVLVCVPKNTSGSDGYSLHVGAGRIGMVDSREREREKVFLVLKVKMGELTIFHV